MAAAIGLQPHCGSMILEGGSIDTNGDGLLITTKSCLLHPRRNPALSQATIESKLMKLLGAAAVGWFDGKLLGDDTDGHIDQLARFTSRDSIAVVAPGNKNDANYPALRTLVKQVEQFAGTHSLRVTELPPPPIFAPHGQPLPASYANFYVANGVVLAPQFKTADDDRALQLLGELFPERKIIPVDCRAVVEGFGAIHCLTQQVPRCSQ